MLTVIAFFAMVLVVVAVHESGHYLAARFYGVRVLRFSVGFGKPFFCKTDRAGTEWALAPIPLGGYVRLLDKESAKTMNLDEKTTMEAQSDFRRIVIYAAGPLANLVLSFVILTGLAMAGEVGIAPRVGSVAEGSPAAEAGLTADETVMEVNGRPTPLWRNALIAIADSALDGDEVRMSTDIGERTIPAGVLQPSAVETGLAAATGIYPDSSYISQAIASVARPSAAADAGILPGDIVVAVDDVIADSWQEMASALFRRPGRPVSLVLWRDDAALTVTATLRTGLGGGGVLGVVPKVDEEKWRAMLRTVRLSPLSAMASAARKTVGDTARTFQFLGHMLGGELSFEKNVSGPVGLARGAGNAAEGGWLSWWRFVALISISLAAINLLPLPVLDGGQIVICAAQMLMRRPLSPKLRAHIDRAGVVLILALMLAVIALDLTNLF